MQEECACCLEQRIVHKLEACGHGYCSECWLRGFAHRALPGAVTHGSADGAMAFTQQSSAFQCLTCSATVPNSFIRTLSSTDHARVVSQLFALQASNTITPVANLIPLLSSFAPVGTTVATALGIVYYHYTTDDERDDGWGCAYRCLQMVLSSYWASERSATPPHSRLLHLSPLPPALAATAASSSSTPPSWHQQHDATHQITYIDASGTIRQMPSLWEIQQRLALQVDTRGRFTPQHIGSCKWIEPFDICAFVRQYGMSAARFSIEQVFDTRCTTQANADVVRALIQHFTERKTAVVIDDLVKAYVLGGIAYLPPLPSSLSPSDVWLLLFDPHFGGPVSYSDIEQALTTEQSLATTTTTTTTTTTKRSAGITSSGVCWRPYCRVFSGKAEWHFCWS
jgi:hypothetical protein